MKRLPTREFDPRTVTIVRRAFEANGRKYASGDVFDWRRNAVAVRRAGQLFDAGFLRHPDESEEGLVKAAEAYESYEDYMKSEERARRVALETSVKMLSEMIEHLTTNIKALTKQLEDAEQNLELSEKSLQEMGPEPVFDFTVPRAGAEESSGEGEGDEEGGGDQQKTGIPDLDAIDSLADLQALATQIGAPVKKTISAQRKAISEHAGAVS